MKAVKRPFGYLIDSSLSEIKRVPKDTTLDHRAGNSTLIAAVFRNGDTLYVKTGAGRRRNMPSFRYEGVDLFPGDGLVQGDGDKPKTALRVLREKVSFVS